MQERYGLAILISVILILLAGHLFLGALGKEAFASPYSEDSEEGELVILAGSIDGIQKTRTGGHLILNVSGVSVFLPGGGETTIPDGSNVSVIGTLQNYRGKKEIVLGSKGDIRLTP